MSARISLLLSVLYVAVFTPPIQADTPHLVRDVNDQTLPVDTKPVPLGRMGDSFYFSGVVDSVAGTTGLYKSDGTAAGTVLLRTFQGDGPFYDAPGVPSFFVAGSRAYFSATEDATGREIWVTDGTPAGTRMIQDTYPGEEGAAQPIAVLGTSLIFASNESSSSWQLFRTDGTPGGTVRLSNFPSFGGPGTATGIVAGGKAFVAVSHGISAVYVTHGNASDAQIVAENPSAPENMSAGSFQLFDGNILFIASTPTHGSEVARIDVATNALTFLEPPGDTTSHAGSGTLVATDDFAFFVGHDGELWRTDGTWAGTQQVVDLEPGPSGSIAGLFSRLGDRVLFMATVGGITHLYSSDGTLGQATLLTGAITGVAPGYSHAAGTAGSRAYFVFGSGNPSNVELRLVSTDGTAPGTRTVPGLSNLFQNNQHAVFATGDDTTTFISGIGIDSTLGTAVQQLFRHVPQSNSTTFLKTLSWDIGYVSHAFSNGVLFFGVFDNSPIGSEPWLSDGTPAGTRLVKNVSQETRTVDSQPNWLTDVNGTLYYTAHENVHGRELWVSDGTEAGTRLVSDLWPGENSSDPIHLFAWNGALYFFAMDGTGQYRFMRTTGPSSPPQVIAQLLPMPTSPAQTGSCTQYSPVVFNGRLYFAAQDGATGLELWSTDGTPAGTSLVVDLAPAGTWTSPCGLTVFRNRLYFRAIEFSGDHRIYSTDGTAAGTTPLLPGPAAAGRAARVGLVFNDALYFTALNASGQNTLWKTDGTSAGTQPVMGSAAPALLAFPVGVANNRLFLMRPQTGLPPPFPTELWVTDGTAAGTNQITNARLDSQSAFQVIGDRAYFVNTTDTADLEPWVSDGTIAGTARLADLNPGGSSTPRWFADFRGVAYLQATDPVRGPGIWRTNGTTAGTTYVGDSARFVNFTAPPRYNPTAVGQALFFVGFDNTVGTELNVFRNEAPIAAADSATSSNGGAIAINVAANDSDLDGAINSATIVIVTAPTNGTAAPAPNGTIVYTPNAGFSGTDSFTYSIADNQGNISGTATVSVTVSQPAPPSGGGGNNGGGAGSGGGGGGGPLGLLDALLLVILLTARHLWIRQPLHRQSPAAARLA